jgi:(p)ppGpp synthase/HD superfamily hydrolase
LRVERGDDRLVGSIPYIAHLLAVAATVLEYGGSEDMAIAGLLHDAAEDQGGEPRLADIRNRFGDRVADIVHACSDSVVNTAAGQQKEDWRTRKMRYIEHLKMLDREICLVSLSDKVHNARSILRDLRKPEVGAAVWSRFGKRPKEDMLWYCRQLASAFQGLLPGELAEELMEIVIVIENE